MISLRTQPRIETLTWDEFFHKAGATSAPVSAGVRRTTHVLKLASPAVLATIPGQTHAASLGSTGLMVHAMWPIISMIQSFAFPLAFLGMSGGMILLTLGNRAKGMNMIKWAAIGYIGFQLVPSMMMMLHHVGATMDHQVHMPLWAGA